MTESTASGRSITDYLRDSAAVLQQAIERIDPAAVEAAAAAIVTALKAGRPLLVCGNGGSASDAMHIAGELVGRYLRERPALKVICLADSPAVLTAWANDYDYDSVFARQVEAYGEPGGVL
ncbi:MAG TPA: SIS domain-containing protein, partial [Alphaproteobacteria bacterium]|nr:SIS domain-containing protein [Alphaproteobacteria bacterium]